MIRPVAPFLLALTLGFAADAGRAQAADPADEAMMAGLRNQISRCWAFDPAGLTDKSVALIRVEMLPDGRVAKAAIVPRDGAPATPAERRLEESALRAVQHPNCQPYKMGDAPYEKWRRLDLYFRPAP